MHLILVLLIVCILFFKDKSAKITIFIIVFAILLSIGYLIYENYKQQQTAIDSIPLFSEYCLTWEKIKKSTVTLEAFIVVNGTVVLPSSTLITITRGSDKKKNGRIIKK